MTRFPRALATCAFGLALLAGAGCTIELASGVYRCEAGDPGGCPSGFTCVSGRCERGTGGGTGDAGADADVEADAGMDAATGPVLCDADEAVVDHACVACVPGSTRPAGDDPSGEDTFCAEVVCEENERVSLHRCVPCAPGTLRPAGDDATGANTFCEPWICAQDEHVVSNACVACPPENTNTAGDEATGGDTLCDGERCASNHHVESGACVPCDPGMVRPAGDDPLGDDTACAVDVCDAGEHVQSNVCVACAAPWTSPGGDSATGADTDCELLAGFARIEAGTFTMGSPAGELGRAGNGFEDQHQVTLTGDFWLQAAEVTQDEFAALMGHNPSHFTSCGGDCPVDQVSFWNAAAYANALSDAEGIIECYSLTGCTGTPGTTGYACTDAGPRNGFPTVYDCFGYRLPTEAEWEYAARAGTTTATYAGDITDEDGCFDDTTVPPIAWFCGNAEASTHPVRTKLANAWGLYDMLGNVREWTSDRWIQMLGTSAVTDPIAAGTGTDFTSRGGSYLNKANGTRAASRTLSSASSTGDHFGFRLARSVQGNYVPDLPGPGARAPAATIAPH